MKKVERIGALLGLILLVMTLAYGCDDDDAGGAGDLGGAGVSQGGEGGGGEGGGGNGDGGNGDGGSGGIIDLNSETIGHYVARTCFNDGDPTPDELLLGISRQLVDAVNCIRPDTLTYLPENDDWRMLDPVRPALVDSRVVDSLMMVAAQGVEPMIIRWAYRDVAVQHLFYQWTLRSCDFAAPPGLSNHQNGLAIDLQEPERWLALMAEQGFINLPNDRPHFDYALADDIGLASLSLFAFQALWNYNYPAAAVPLTGEYDTLTAEALSKVPMGGLPHGLCEGGESPVDPPAHLGPTLAQAAWRGCSPPSELAAGLSAQLIDEARCLEPGALVPLDSCDVPGCVSQAVSGFLGADTVDALRLVSLSLGYALEVDVSFVEPAYAHYASEAASNLGCPDFPQAGRGPFATGHAVRVAPDEATGAALEGAGFVADPVWPDVWVLEGADDLTALGVLAFQGVWNANRPEELLEEDGLAGPKTWGALDRSPSRGFEEAACADPRSGCAVGCENQACSGVHEWCDARYGACAPVPCEADADCAHLWACDRVVRPNLEQFRCVAAQCERR